MGIFYTKDWKLTSLWLTVPQLRTAVPHTTDQTDWSSKRDSQLYENLCWDPLPAIGQPYRQASISVCIFGKLPHSFLAQAFPPASKVSLGQQGAAV